MAIDLESLGGTNLHTFKGANPIGQGQPIESVGTETPAPAPTITLCSYGNKLTREEFARVATPAGTAMHTPILHTAVVEKLFEALSFRRIGVREDHAVSSAGTVVSPRPICGKEDLGDKWD